MKNPNGYGGVRKLHGNRRRPFQVVVTVGRDIEKQIQKTVGYYKTREEALMALSDYNKNPFNVIDNPTFKEVYELLDKKDWSKSKARSMKTAYKRSKPLHDMCLKEIKKIHLQHVADSFVEFSPATMGELKLLWHTEFTYGMENDICEKDYSSFVKYRSNKKVRHATPFTPGEVELMCDDLKILCYTGMRISEYLSVKIEDIHDGVIYLYGTKTEAAERIIPIHEKIAAIIDTRLKQTYLCEHDGNKVLYDYFLKNIYNVDMKKLGITGHRIHDTRATFATFAVKTMHPVIEKKIIGHKIKDITEDVYIKRPVEEYKEEMKKMKIENTLYN